MTDDEFDGVRGWAANPGKAPEDVTIGRSVKAIAADLVLLVVAVWQPVQEGLAWQRGVKGRAEHRDVTGVRRESAAGEVAFEVDGVVQGGAISEQASMSASTASSMSADAVKASPPWTIRWPMP